MASVIWVFHLGLSGYVMVIIFGPGKRGSPVDFLKAVLISEVDASMQELHLFNSRGSHYNTYLYRYTCTQHVVSSSCCCPSGA